MSRHGGGSLPHPPEIIEQIRQLWLQEATSGEIAKEIGFISRSGIMSIISRGRDRDGADMWPERKKGPKRFRSKMPKPKSAKKPHRRPYSAERPKPVSTTTQHPFVNPEPPRESVKPIRFSLRALNQCAFIEGEPSDDALCCGAPVEPGFSWCSYHLDQVSETRRRLRRAA